MSWIFNPDAILLIGKVDPVTQALRDVYRCDTMVDQTYSLATADSVGQGSFKLANDGSYYANADEGPQFNDIVCYLIKNRYGDWGVEWTGLLDESHISSDPTQGAFVTLQCTSPQKYFEVRRQTANDVVSLDVASFTGVKGADLLRFACEQARVNYPGPLRLLPQMIGEEGLWGRLPPLAIDSTADSAVMPWVTDISSDFTDPSQQTWNSLVSTVAATCGVEWFFDECGRSIWRSPGFLAKATTATPIPPDEIFSIDLFSSDTTAVTRVEVRWGQSQLIENSAWWQAPVAMVQQLGSRTIVVSAPWIWGDAAGAEAQNLAALLGQFYSANLLQGSVIVPANHRYKIGDLVRIPAVGGTKGGVYYVKAKMGRQTWGGPWVQVLGLAYGRDENSVFPYNISSTYQITAINPKAGIRSSRILDTSYSLGSSTFPFTLVAKAGLNSDQTIADPTLVPAGASVRFQAGTTAVGQNSVPGAVVGPSPTGTYDVLEGTVGQGYILYVQKVTSVKQVYVLIQSPGYGTDPTLTSNITPDKVLTVGPTTTLPGTGWITAYPTNLLAPDSSLRLLGHYPTNLAQDAYAWATTKEGALYISGTSGPNSWDCCGLVSWAYTQASGTFYLDRGPGNLHDYWLSHGATELDWSKNAPQVGDLCFYWTPEAIATPLYRDTGQGHVSFADGKGGTFGAYGPDNTHGIGFLTDFRASAGPYKPLRSVLNMQNIGQQYSAIQPTGVGSGNYTTAQIIAATNPAVPANVTMYWPLVYAALYKVFGTVPKSLQAYAIAIILEETTSFAPITEVGLGVGKPYYPTYYGRGFIQLTWASAYKKYSDLINSTRLAVVDLVGTPNQALDPTVAAYILALFIQQNGIDTLLPSSQWQEAYRRVSGSYTGPSRLFNGVQTDAYTIFITYVNALLLTGS